MVLSTQYGAWGWWGWGWTGDAMKPKTGVWSPEWVATTRYPGDRYVSTNGVIYVNPNASGTTGWLVEQDAPAI